MDAKMDDSLAVGILISSIDLPELKPVVAAIKTLSDNDATWETISERLIDECRGFGKTVQLGESSTAASANCNFCSKRGHRAEKCWINPANPNNRLKALRGAVRRSKETSHEDDHAADSNRNRNRKKDE